ncbi:DUF3072 domain-containing protein [Nonomuraea wenchangensis]
MSHGPVEKDPEEWTTGDEPMTAPQESYLRTLAREAGREVPEGLSKADASRMIDELQQDSERLRDAPSARDQDTNARHRT